MIELNNIHVIYNKGKQNEVYALRGINLSIPTGSFFAIIGPSGSGKSTLLHVIGGLLKPDSGSCMINGRIITMLNNRQLAHFRNKEIGFVLQDFGLIRNESVLDNVMIPMLVSRERIKGMEKRAAEALAMLRIDELAHRKVHQLSGGQCQRVAVARAIVMNPSIILADEPTGALDAETAYQLMDVFAMLQREGKTIVMVTHNTNLCGMCDHTVTISDGRIMMG